MPGVLLEDAECFSQRGLPRQNCPWLRGQDKSKIDKFFKWFV